MIFGYIKTALNNTQHMTAQLEKTTWPNCEIRTLNPSSNPMNLPNLSIDFPQK